MIPPNVVLDVRTVTTRFPGIGRVVLGASRALAGLGPLTLIHGAPLDPRLPVPPLEAVRCSSGPFGVRQQLEVPRLLRACRARLYHSPYYLMPYRPGVPAVVNCFDLIPLLVPGTFDRGRRFAYSLAHRLAFRAAAAICVPSRATRDDVARLFPSTASRLTIVRPGVKWGQAPFPAECAEAEDGFPPRFLLHVGSNKPHKDIAVLVKAWSAAVRAAPDVTRGTTLVLAGPRDPRYPEPARSIERFGVSARVLDLGAVSDVRLDHLYARAALFVLPSRREGFGLPLAEAMAHGRPCICSDTPALAETAGGAAAVFPAGDAPTLADQIVRLLADAGEAQRLGSLGAARAACFDWGVSARETVAVYERVLTRC
jgi:alpha-1,3-rhamnosyl/mannosyltransferase